MITASDAPRSLRKFQYLILILSGTLATCAAEDPVSMAEGVQVELFATEPMIRTPTGIAVDADGRVFVAESHTHFRPDDYSGPGHDRILRLDDTNGDGKADKQVVFHSGFTHVMDLEFNADGWLFVATRKDIHRMRDGNGDGTADVVEPVVKMDTTGTYPHNGISGLCFNHDGTLNFGLGENLGHDYTLIGTDGTTLSGGGEGGSTWHVSADGTNLRQVTTGWWNPYGMCVDAHGRIFGTDNDPGASPPCRLIQVHEGADYGYEYRYGRTGLHPLISWAGDLPGNIPMIAGTGEAPCGIIPTERTNLPAELRNDLLVACWADHRIERFSIVQSPHNGQVTAVRSVLIEGPNDFRPVGLCVAPSGDIFVSDWVLASYQLHGRGRVWRIRGPSNSAVEQSTSVTSDAEVAEGTVQDLLARLATATLSTDADLVERALRSSDRVLRHTAIQILAREVDSSQFAERLENADANTLLAFKRSSRRATVPTQLLSTALQNGDAAAWGVAVKWIADDQISALRPVLQAQLDRSDLTVDQFLVLSAALDRVDGRKPRDVPDDGSLKRVVLNATRSAALRAAALQLLSPSGNALSIREVVSLLESPSAKLRRAAVRQLRGRKAPRVTAILRQLAENEANALSLRLEAIDALATVRDSALTELLSLLNGTDETIKAAVLQALAGAKLSHADRKMVRGVSSKTIEAAKRVDGQNFDRPAATDIDAWLTLLAEPGDAAAGERVFFHSAIGTCGRCHQHSGRGTAVGPALSLISRRLPQNRDAANRWLLETILQPSAEMAPQFTPWTIVTTDGKQLTGLPRRKGGTKEAYLGIDGKEFTVNKDSIEYHQESRVSIMPEGLLQLLTIQELRDLFAFLRSDSN